MGREERPAKEATMTHDNFPGHYTAYKTYYLSLPFFLQLLLHNFQHLQQMSLAAAAPHAFFLVADLSGGYGSE